MTNRTTIEQPDRVTQTHTIYITQQILIEMHRNGIYYKYEDWLRFMFLSRCLSLSHCVIAKAPPLFVINIILFYFAPLVPQLFIYYVVRFINENYMQRTRFLIAL